MAVSIGMAVAVQSRINGELGQRLHDGLIAAVLSNAGGLVLLLGLVAAQPMMRGGLRRVATAVRARRLAPYQLLGGVCGAFLVACQGLTVATIGVAVFTVAVVAGQAASALLVDRAGIGPGRPQPISVRRACGAAVALVAVALAVSPRLGVPHTLWMSLLPVLAGAGTAWQQAVNGLVAAAAQQDGRPRMRMLPAALINFAVGTAALAAGAAVDLAARGAPAAFPAQPWLYLGGPLGVLAVAASAAIVGRTGVLLLSLGAVAGQLLGSVLLDLLLPAGPPLTALTLMGTALTLVAVAVAAPPARRPARPPVQGCSS